MPWFSARKTAWGKKERFFSGLLLFPYLLADASFAKLFKCLPCARKGEPNLSHHLACCRSEE